MEKIKQAKIQFNKGVISYGEYLGAVAIILQEAEQKFDCFGADEVPKEYQDMVDLINKN